MKKNTLIKLLNKSIRIIPNGFIVYHQANNSNEVIKKTFNVSWNNRTSELLLPLIVDEQKEVRLFVQDLQPVLIPKKLYCTNKDKEYFELNFSKSPVGIPYKDEIEDYYSLYFVDNKLADDIASHGFKINVSHFSTFLYNFSNLYCNEENIENQLSAFIENNFIDIICRKNRKLVLINRFNIFSEYDALFYMINVIEKFDIDKNNVNISIFNVMDYNIEKIISQYLPITTSIN